MTRLSDLVTAAPGGIAIAIDHPRGPLTWELPWERAEELIEAIRGRMTPRRSMARPVYYIAAPLRPIEAEIQAIACSPDPRERGPAIRAAIAENLARAQRWFVWLRRFERCTGIVLCGGRCGRCSKQGTKASAEAWMARHQDEVIGTTTRHP